MAFSVKYQMTRFSILVGILLWQSIALSTQATERVALIIGNGQYKAFGTLLNPINDAKDIAQALKYLGFRVIYQENATKRLMQQVINQFTRQLHKNSIGVFYYAGHGTQYAGENYLIPVDFNGHYEQDYKQQAIVAYQILVDMKTRGSSTSIMILDACRDNPLAQSKTRGLTRYRSGVKNGLTSMQEMSGSYIAFSTSPGKVAYDGEGRNSPYARHLIRFIKEPIPIEVMFKRVRTAVIEETRNKNNGTQVPWETSSLVGADFCFLDGCGQQRTIARYRYQVTQCKMRWGKGEYQGDCKNGRPNGYGVQRYPNGEYYKGSFQNGLRHGEGIQYLPDGTEIIADWENGRPK
jgi:uncharacterized caspase-like protein